MKHNLVKDFAVDKATNTVIVTREFNAGIELVWDAFTKSELLDQWWAPKPWKAKTKKQEFKPGGQWLYAMTGPNGEEHWSFVNYKDIATQQYYTGQDAFSDSDGNINADMPVSDWKVSFTDKGETTLVETKMKFSTLEQLEEIIKMGFKEGYSSASDTLDELLEQWKK